MAVTIFSASTIDRGYPKSVTGGRPRGTAGGRVIGRGAGQLGSPKFTSIPAVSRAVPRLAGSFTRTPVYSSSSRTVVAATLVGLNTSPSARSRAAIARTRRSEERRVGKEGGSRWEGEPPQ